MRIRSTPANLRIATTILSVLLGLVATAQPFGDKWDYRAVMGHNPLFGVPTGKSGEESPLVVNSYGIDISYWQGTINFVQVKTAASFVIMRASYGASSVDANFGTNRAAAQAQNIPLGFYHYSYPQFNSAATEANNFLNRIGTLQAGQVVVLDYEENWSGDAVGWCKTWLDTVYASTGVKPFLYINLSINNSYNWAPVVNAGYPIWLARWDYNRDANPPATDWPVCKLRQYSNSESIPGITGNVDGDTFYGTVDEFKAFGKVVATADWIPPSPVNQWYRTNEFFSYTASGQSGFLGRRYINGVQVSSSSNTSGTFGLYTAVTDGPKEVWVRVDNPNGTWAETDHLFCGLDRVAPTIALTGPVVPSQWYTSAQSVQFTANDAHAGLRRWRYRWDAQAFSPWVNGTPTSLPLMFGKHSLTIEAEDLTYSGITQSGNVSSTTLGEFWMDDVPHTLVMGVEVLRTREPQLRITLSNPNISPSSNVVVDSVKLGTVTQPGNWTIGTLAEGTSASRTYSVPNLKNRTARQFLVLQAHIGSTPITLQQWVDAP